jgi:WD40 repeat protein
MHILCPHCRNPIEVTKLTPHAEISCPSCGSSFHLESETTTADYDPERDRMHRIRLGCVLRACPRLLLAWPNEHAIWRMDYSPDGRFLLTAGFPENNPSNGKVYQLWDARTGTPLPLDVEKPAGAAFHPRLPRIAVAGRDWQLHLLDLPTRKRVAGPWPLAGVGDARSVAFSPDGKYVAAGRRTITVWDAASGKPLGKPFPGDPARFSPDGTRLLLWDGSVWDWASARQVFRPPQPHQAETLSPPSFSPDGPHVLINHTTGDLNVPNPRSDIRVYEVASGRSVSGQLGQYSLYTIATAFSPSGRHVASTAEDALAWVWDVESGKPTCPPLRHADPIDNVVFSPDGRLVLTASADLTARVWDVQTGEAAGAVLRHKRRVFCGAFHPGGRLVATGGYGGSEIRVWEWPPGGEVAMPTPPEVRDADLVRLGRNGRIVATFQKGRGVRCIDLKTGKTAGTPFDPGTRVEDMRFLDDDRVLWTHGVNGLDGRLWDVKTGGRGPPSSRGRASRTWESSRRPSAGTSATIPATCSSSCPCRTKTAAIASRCRTRRPARRSGPRSTPRTGWSPASSAPTADSS